MIFLLQVTGGKTQPTEGKTAHFPGRELAHPVSIAAIGLLAANDWWLKPSGLAPAWAGKLSDFAGLLFFPLVLTAGYNTGLFVLRRWFPSLDPRLTRRELITAIAITGILFAACKLSQSFADAIAAALSLAFPGSAIVADPADLIALPMLAVAYWIGHEYL